MPIFRYSMNESAYSPDISNVIANDHNSYTIEDISSSVDGLIRYVDISFNYTTINDVSDGLTMPNTDSNYNVIQFGGVTLGLYTVRPCFMGYQGTITAIDSPTFMSDSNIENLFNSATGTSYNFQHWNMSNVISAKGVFSDTTNFNQDISSWDMSNVTNLSYMFNGALAYNTDISWNTPSLTTIERMFKDATAFNSNVYIDVENVSTMVKAFELATSFNKPLNHWNLGTVNTHFNYMFNGASSFNQPLNSWNVSKAQSIQYMFQDATSFDQPLEWYFVNSIDSLRMFDGCTSLNSDISLNLSTSVNVAYLFRNCSSLNSNITLTVKSGANISFLEMFKGCTVFNGTLIINGGDQITSTQSMFEGCTAFNQPLDYLNMSSNTNMQNMFNGASSFNQPINSWNVSQVGDIIYMFDGASSFNQPLNSWNTINVGNMEKMFRNAKSFNQDISNWDVAGVIDFNQMFYGATSFNQNIGPWNFSGVSSASSGYLYFVTNTGINSTNYGQMLIDISTNNTMKTNADWSVTGLVRNADDVDVSNAYIYLTEATGKNMTIIDAGSLPSSDLAIYENIVIPDVKLTADNSGNTTVIPTTQQYTIVTDSGGKYGLYDNDETYDHTFTFVNGVRFKLDYKVENGIDNIKVYDSSSLLGTYTGTGDAEIDITGINTLTIQFITNSTSTYSGFMGYIEIVPEVVAEICFPAFTPVTTDQGNIFIHKIDPKIHTIDNLPIISITKTLGVDKELVYIKKFAFGSTPYHDTIMTKNHLLSINGRVIPAKHLVPMFAHYIPYNGCYLYNVLMEDHNAIQVNGLTVETLHPDNFLSKLTLMMSDLSIENQSKTFSDLRSKLAIRQHQIL